MSSGYEPGLAMKILHRDVKDHVAAHKLMIRRWGRTICQDVESNTHIFHLLFNDIPPEGGASGLINGICLFDGLGDFDPVLMSAFMVSSALTLNQGDNQVSLLEDPAGFISNLRGKCELSNL